MSGCHRVRGESEGRVAVMSVGARMRRFLSTRLALNRSSIREGQFFLDF